MKNIHEISKAIASLKEQPSGKMVFGFTVLAPAQLSGFSGGAKPNEVCPTINNNCGTANCIKGCGKEISSGGQTPGR